ncbi:c-type cytochrome [Sulfurimonas autotrophica]|uniref:Cytochrome c class I n=1 Tax=Sulfurimonas autotrophica (strain ATCC BAA-671 / DSM 16294 / JCM 11897 / OK10) TaxID=563040 RepID=E0UQR1_SULAO|nr:c-type cytochrome [Sulfurimonas autotrophica]ADN09933.1 cytochrome c class I [Sulfurimonas autotrophica DSM 16294]
MKIILGFVLIFFFAGCEKKHTSNLDGKKLLEEKCSACHNLDLPPKTFTDEKAPPMMAVAFHIKDFIKAGSESDKIPKAIDFVKDYVVNPNASKSFCDKKSLESYGVMPSQKANVTQNELEAIAEYMFEHYTLKNLTKAQAIENRLRKMPAGERLALKYNCLSCHKKEKDVVGPSFAKIAARYSDDVVYLKKSIEDGSAKRWKDYRGAVMPSFRNKISDKELDVLVEWISKMKRIKEI